MKKLLGGIKKKNDSPERNGTPPAALPQGDAPDAVVVREVTAFCESGSPNAQGSGEEYLHLPAIVDAAESSPAAARAAAATIRGFLAKEHYRRGFAQYNAVMLMRILTDNPAHAFTRNFDAKFVSTVKELLREGRDASVQQILRETLDYFEADKAPGNDSLSPLMDMWRKEKGKHNTIRQSHHRVPPPPAAGFQPPATHRGPTLPPPQELASRIEEAKTTARLLVQTVQSTPQAELLANDLVQEFGDRARTAQRSIQGFMGCQNPAPDPDTMLTLIETNDQLNIAMSKHQRAVLQARKSTSTPTSTPPVLPTEVPGNPVAMPQHSLGQNVYVAAENNPYAASPPPVHGRQGTLPAPLEPTRPHAEFAPPPGPPPGAMGAVRSSQPPSEYDYATAYSPPAGPPPISARDHAKPVAQSSTAAYGVADNPFDDDAYGEGAATNAQPHALFDRADAPPPQSMDAPYRHELSDDTTRPGPYNVGFQPTPSYMHRQDSSAANVTMHGGSPPPAANGEQHPTTTSIDDGQTQGLGQKMNELHV